MNYPQQTLGELIAARARAAPDALAVAQWGTRLTYRDVVGRAAVLAAELRSRGVRPETRVGVSLPRTPDLVVAVVGVVLAGGAYVPLDPEYPQARRRDIAADADVTMVIGDGAGMLAVPPAGDLDALAPCPAGLDDLVHVLYTSGSTGRPKGVLTTHRNIVEFVTNCAAFTGADASIRSLGIASLGFDATTMDFFVPLTVGGSIALTGEADRADPTRLRRFLRAHEVNWGFITPAVLALLDPAGLPAWRVVMCGGEVVPTDLAHRWLAPGRRFFHVYGPTEATVLAIGAEVTGDEIGPLPLGWPLANHTARIVEGELLLGGPGIARGYLNQPALTAERFVPDPEATDREATDREATDREATDPPARFYRTGDYARLRADGQVEYLGRRDGQVKVRGQRIETGEIEAVLREHPGVDQAVVVPIERPAGAELVAFVTPAGAPDDVLPGAANRLTAAMVPSRVIRLDALPRNESGKVDRARLASLDETVEAELAAPPDPGVETDVAGVWQRVLGRAPGRDTVFFAAGGNSISAMRFVSALRAELARDVAVEDVFAGRTLAGIAALVAKAGLCDGDDLDLGNPPTLSSPQRRMWFADQLAPDQAPYNIGLAQRLHGPLDPDALRAALHAVAVAHDVLRWRIPAVGGVPYPVCDPASHIALPVVDVTEPELSGWLAAGARTVFDLAAAAGWRVTLFRLGPADHVLAITLHHAIFDGWSQRVLYADLATAYTGRPLAARPATYADYAVWRERRDAARGHADLAWWLSHLDGAPTIVDLPRDRPRPAVATYHGAEAGAAFDASGDAAVRRLAADLGTTAAIVLLAAFGELLRRTTGRDDHVIGAVVADRRRAEFDDLLGFFIDMIPVRLRGADCFADLVRDGGAELLAATAHPAAPVERVVGGLGLTRDTSRAPLVQVMFNVLNFTEPVLDLPGVQAATLAVPKPGSPLDITVYVLEHDGRLAVEAVYNPDLFDSTRVTALLEDYVALAGALAAAPDQPIAGMVPVLPRDYPPAAGAMTVVTEASGTAGSAATEQLVAGVWREALGRDHIDPTENFFDVGGTSLALVAVRSRLTELLDRPLAVVDLFRYPNIRALAAFLDGAADNPELAMAARRVAARRAGHRNRRGHRAAESNAAD
jgi:mycobactin peptide synthetase MbtE